MKVLIIGACLLELAGCGAAPLKCEPAQVVEKPVAVGCLGDAPARPVDAFGVDTYPGDKTAAQAALVDREAWKVYASRLEAAVAGCDKGPASAKKAIP